MAASNALIYPLPSTAYRLYFWIQKTDGTLLNGVAWTGLNAGVGITLYPDGSSTPLTYTGTPTQIGTTEWGYLDLLNTEIGTVKWFAGHAAVTNTGALQTPLSFGVLSSADVLPAVAQGASGGLPTLNSNLDVQADPQHWKGGLIPTPNVTGVPKIDLSYILGTLLTETAGQIAAGFKKFFNIPTPAATMDHGVLVDTATALGAAYDAAKTAATQASVNAIPTNPLLTNDGRLNALDAPISGIPTNPLLTTDSRLDDLNAPIGSIPTNPLLDDDVRLPSGTTPISTLTQAQVLSDATPFPGADIALIKTDTGNLISRLGAFVGSGVNTVLGFLQAIMRSDVSAPSGVGGTFDPATDSEQALSAKITSLPVPATAVQVRQEIDSNSTQLALLLARLTNTRAGLLDNLSLLDVATSELLTTADYTAPDNAGINTLLTRISAARALLLDNLTLVDIAVSTRLAAAGYTVPPTTGSISQAIIDKVVPNGQPTNSIGLLLRTAGSATDPLTNLVPGVYEEGSGGYALGLLSSGRLTILSPLDAITGDLELVRGDDYDATHHPIPPWTSSAWASYNLDDGTTTVAFKALATGGTLFTTPCVIQSATSVYVELTHTQTSAFPAGTYSMRYELEATLTSGEVITLARGRLSILEDLR